MKENAVMKGMQRVGAFGGGGGSSFILSPLLANFECVIPPPLGPYYAKNFFIYL